MLKIPRPRGSAEYPFAVRSVFAFGHRCSLLCDARAKALRSSRFAKARSWVGKNQGRIETVVTGRSGPRLNGGTPLLVELCGHAYLRCTIPFILLLLSGFKPICVEV